MISDDVCKSVDNVPGKGHQVAGFPNLCRCKHASPTCKINAKVPVLGKPSSRATV